MDEKKRMLRIGERLEVRFPSEPTSHNRDPFAILVATILSQNTNDLNSQRAFERMKERFMIVPQVIANLELEELKPVIKMAGLSEIKSRRIIEVSREVLKRFEGNLNKVFSLPLEDARKALMDIRGIGPKTADVLLSLGGGKSIMPVDTNIFRVVDRLCFAKGRNYERTRLALEHLIPEEKLHEMHVLLITLGRELCKARRPLCASCPLNDLCDFGVTQLRSSGVTGG